VNVELRSAPSPPPLSPQSTIQNARSWYSGVTGYQWLVLALASAGWIFDIFEGQIFNITRNPLLMEVLHVPAGHPAISYWGDVLLVPFLLGGALGGVMFGMLADRWGRGASMILTILMYAVFSGLTYFATTLWQVAALRFLVAVGVGGEWAVAAALVAEVFPERARAHASGIFHASSVLGTWIATGAGLLVGSNWRYAYLVGVLPALLVLLVRAFVREPDAWRRAKSAETSSASTAALRFGSLADLLANPIYRRRAILGLLLAAVGLGGFWGVMVAGQNLVEHVLLVQGVAQPEAAQRAKFAYGIVQTAGGGVGLLMMGPLATRIGRRLAFVAFQIGAVVVTPITCFLPTTYNQLLVLLPVFGFFNLGLHAGYAIYFPELFPTRLRATGSGLCFNGGRLVAASMLLLSGWLKARPGMDLRWAITLLGMVYLLGVVLVLMLPETRGRALEE
jgi:MFS family permease